MQWVLYDALRGSRFIKKGHSTSSATLDFADAKVERVKGSGRNAYVVNGVVLEDIGKGTPSEARAALNIRPVVVDADLEIELHVAPETDFPFLMDSARYPGTARAKVLNVLSGAHVLDIALRSTATKIRQHKAVESDASDELARMERELPQFAGLEAEDVQIQNAHQMVERIGRLVELVRNTRSLLLERAGILPRLVPAKDHTAELDVGMERLASLLSQRDTLTQLMRVRSETAVAEAAVQASQAHLDYVMAQFRKSVGSRCPTCGQPITERCLEEVEN